MKQRALDFYLCANCSSTQLKVVDEGDIPYNAYEEILQSSLICDNCGTVFPVINGVPRFVPLENYADTFGLQWNFHTRTQLDSHTGLPISRNRLFQTTGWQTISPLARKEMDGQIILEAGSGAGRFTEILLETGAEVFSFDYSSAVDANWQNNGHSPKLHIFQGNIYDIPLRKCSFDKVLYLGVLQHTPDPEKAFKSLCQYLRSGGEIVIDVYCKRLSSLLHWKYLFRPLTKRMNKERLYNIIQAIVPILLPPAIYLRRIAGKFGTRLLPITEYSNLELPYELNKQWSILDTFDMYAPVYDKPQTLLQVKKWFNDAGLEDIFIGYGSNGIIGRGKKP